MVMNKIVQKCVMIACLIITCVYPLALEANSPRVVEIPFEQVNGLIIINATLEDIQGKFIFDTGAEEFIVNEATHSSDVIFSSIAGDIPSTEIDVDKMEIGTLIHEDIKAYSADLQTIEQFLRLPIRGIIGCKLFLPRLVKIDYEMGVITASEQGDFGVSQLSEIKFEMKDGVPVCPLEINGQTYWFGFDSGATIHVLDERLLPELRHLVKQTGKESYVTTGVDQKSIQSIVALDQFTLGKRSINNSEFLVQNLELFNESMEQDISGVLSLNGLKANVVIIDLEEKRIWF